MAASAAPITHIMSAQPTSPARSMSVRCMLAFCARCGARSPGPSTMTMLSAPFPGSGPTSAWWLRTSEESVAPVSETRRAHSAPIAPGESRSDPVTTRRLTRTRQPPANTRNVRRDARHADDEAVAHIAADRLEDQEEARGAEVRDVAQPWHEVAAEDAGQHREQQEADHRPVGRRPVEVQPVRRDLPHEGRDGEQKAERLEGRQVEAADRDLERLFEERGRERRAEEHEPEDDAEREPAVQELHERGGDEPEVEPEAPVADVEDVVAQLVSRVREVAPAELREAGHPRPHDEPRRVVRDVARRGGEKDRADRPGADQVHVAAEHVQELGDLVELAALEEATDRRVERLVRRQEPRADPPFRIHEQCPELVDRERPEVAANAAAAVEDRSAARELDREGDEQRDGEQDEQPRDGDRHLPPAAPSAVRPEAELAPRRLEIRALDTEADHEAPIRPSAACARRGASPPTAGRTACTASYQRTSTSSAQMARLWSARRVMCSVTRRPTAAGSSSPSRRSRAGASTSCVKSRSSPTSQPGMGTLKPRLRPSTTAAGSRPAIARRRRYFVVRPRRRSRAGSRRASSITPRSRNGTRASSEWAMLMRSTFTRMSAGRNSVASTYCRRSSSSPSDSA